MRLSRKWIIAILLAFLLVVVGLVLFFVHKKHSNPTYAVISRNKDTGQTIISTPNQSPEKYGSSQYVNILGANKLLNVGMSPDEFTLTETLLTKYVNQQLRNRYSQVAILNDGFSINGTTINARMRLGTSPKLLNIQITFTSLVNVDLKISDPGGNPIYAYDSGVQTVSD